MSSVSFNESQRQLMARKRAGERDLTIPEPADAVRREDMEADDAAWLRFYLPDVFHNPFTADQRDMIADVGHVLRYGVRQCKAAPRGSGKSSIIKYLVLKYALERRIQFPVVIAATFGKAQKMTSSLKKRLASKADSPLSADYPLECHVARHVNPWPSRARNVTANGGRTIHTEWGSADGYFILPSWEDEEPCGPIMMSIGWQSDELQGCNVYDRRPDVVILDDLDSRDSLAAVDGRVAEKIGEVITKTVAGLGGQSKRLGQYFVCTITSTESAAFRFSDPMLEPSWDGKRVAAIKAWPTNMHLWDDYTKARQKGQHEGDKYGRIAHQMYLDNREEMDAGTEVSNPHDFDAGECPDGSQMEVSNLQRCMNFIADTGRGAFDTEYQNAPEQDPNAFKPALTNYAVLNCETDFTRGFVEDHTAMVVRGVDVRKIELHYATISTTPTIAHRIPDYGVKSHGTTETTVEMAEELILEGLHLLADGWDGEPLWTESGEYREADLTLIDAGWMGSWDEDGETKVWATQPVETFCIQRPGNLRRWMPAMGAPAYRGQKPSREVIIGNHWHLNLGYGAARGKTLLVWDVEYWRGLLEDLFVTEELDQRFHLFESEKGIYSNHNRFSEHLKNGAEDRCEQRKRSRATRKRRFRRDHWWDAMAMALVAKSLESHIRQTPKLDTWLRGERKRRNLGDIQRGSG